MVVEIRELVRYDVSVWQEVKFTLAKLLLHFSNIHGELVLPRDLETLREMVYFLILIQAFVEVVFARATAPKDIPLVRLSMVEVMCLQQRPYKLGISPENFVQQLTVSNMVIVGIPQCRWGIIQQLPFAYSPKVDEFLIRVPWLVVDYHP